MSILDKTKIGNSVRVNLEQTKGRLPKEVIEALNTSSFGKISDFRITDGKGIGVILKLYNGAEQWFFEDEIDILDENGNVIRNNCIEDEKAVEIFNILKQIKYEEKNKVSDLLNPFNFFLWLIVSVQDIF